VTLVFHVSFWNHPLGADRELCLGLCFGETGLYLHQSWKECKV